MGRVSLTPGKLPDCSQNKKYKGHFKRLGTEPRGTSIDRANSGIIKKGLVNE